MLCELVTGRPPIAGDDATAVSRQHSNTAQRSNTAQHSNTAQRTVFRLPWDLRWRSTPRCGRSTHHRQRAGDGSRARGAVGCASTRGSWPTDEGLPAGSRSRRCARARSLGYWVVRRRAPRPMSPTMSASGWSSSQSAGPRAFQGRVRGDRYRSIGRPRTPQGGIRGDGVRLHPERGRRGTAVCSTLCRRPVGPARARPREVWLRSRGEQPTRADSTSRPRHAQLRAVSGQSRRR